MKSRPCQDLHYQQDEEEDSMGLGACVRPWRQGVGFGEEAWKSKTYILSFQDRVRKNSDPEGLNHRVGVDT